MDKNDASQPPAEPCHFTTAISPVQENIKQKIDKENERLVGFYRNSRLGQLSQADQKKTSSREEILKEYRVDLKHK